MIAIVRKSIVLLITSCLISTCSALEDSEYGIFIGFGIGAVILILLIIVISYLIFHRRNPKHKNTDNKHDALNEQKSPCSKSHDNTSVFIADITTKEPSTNNSTLYIQPVASKPLKTNNEIKIAIEPQSENVAESQLPPEPQLPHIVGEPIAHAYNAFTIDKCNGIAKVYNSYSTMPALRSQKTEKTQSIISEPHSDKVIPYAALPSPSIHKKKSKKSKKKSKKSKDSMKTKESDQVIRSMSMDSHAPIIKPGLQSRLKRTLTENDSRSPRSSHYGAENNPEDLYAKPMKRRESSRGIDNQSFSNNEVQLCEEEDIESQRAFNDIVRASRQRKKSLGALTTTSEKYNQGEVVDAFRFLDEFEE